MQMEYVKGLAHVHTRFSYDGKLSLKQLADFCLRKGFNFVLLSEHWKNLTPVRMERLVQQCYQFSRADLLLVPGLELELFGNKRVHLLAYGIKSIPVGGTAIEIIAHIHRQKGLAVMAHPSSQRYTWVKEFGAELDGIEIWNATYDSRYLPSVRSIRLFSKLRRVNPSLVALAGLDMHNLSEFRGLYLEVLCSQLSTEGLIASIRTGNFRIRNRFLTYSARPSVCGPLFFLLIAGRLGIEIADGVLHTAMRLFGTGNNGKR